MFVKYLKSEQGVWERKYEDEDPWGVTTLLPYPNELVNGAKSFNYKNYTFSVWHMHEDGDRVGKIEDLEFKATEAGIEVRLDSSTGYSPVMIAWKESAQSRSGGGAILFGGDAVRTGDEAQMMVWAASGLASAAGALGIGSQFKKGKKGR